MDLNFNKFSIIKCKWTIIKTIQMTHQDLTLQDNKLTLPLLSMLINLMFH